MKLRLIECREPRELDVWLHSALRVAKVLNPYLAPDDAGAVWLRIERSPCFGDLRDFQRRWIALFRAVGARDAARMAEFGSQLLGSDLSFGSDAREYLLMAAMAGYIADRRPAQALELWRAHSGKIPRAAAMPAFRLLRCHAEPRSCARGVPRLRRALSGAREAYAVEHFSDEALEIGAAWPRVRNGRRAEDS